MGAHEPYPACRRLGAYGSISAWLNSRAGTWLPYAAMMGLCNQHGACYGPGSWGALCRNLPGTPQVHPCLLSLDRQLSEGRVRVTRPCLARSKIPANLREVKPEHVNKGMRVSDFLIPGWSGDPSRGLNI